MGTPVKEWLAWAAILCFSLPLLSCAGFFPFKKTAKPAVQAATEAEADQTLGALPSKGATEAEKQASELEGETEAEKVLRELRDRQQQEEQQRLHRTITDDAIVTGQQ